MATHATGLAADSKIARKSLKTYSRRAPKRRMTSPLVPTIDHDPRLVQSFIGVVEQPKTPDTDAQQPGFPVPGPKRVRLSAPEQGTKSPTDLFFEMISSSAPELLQPQEDDQLEGGQLKEEVLPTTEADDDNLEDNEDSPGELLGGPGVKTEVETDGSQESAMKTELEESVSEAEDNDGGMSKMT